MKKRTIALMMAVVMLFGVTIGGTIAWLMANTNPVVNTFTVGDINITLEETDSVLDATDNTYKKGYKIIPGTEESKDPKVTVEAGSEDCWLFVKVEKTGSIDYVTYDIATGWNELSSVPGVYWREAKAGDVFDVLLNNKVSYNENITKEQLDVATPPTLKFTAYAVQKENVADAATAWGYVNP